MSLALVVLAAGQGLRMCSDLPKVLHPIGNCSILGRILSTISTLQQDQIIVVYGHKGEQLKQAFIGFEPQPLWVDQGKTLGTGHAVLQALPLIANVDRVLILLGDVPLIKAETLEKLLNITDKNSVALITEVVENPTGLGRILRDKQGNVLKIVEEKDATAEQKKITEINAGIFSVPKDYLQKWIPKLSNQNTQKEYLLTDIIAMAIEEGVKVQSISPLFEWEVRGVNDKVQLAQLERIFQLEEAKKLMQQGVTLLDPARLDIRGEVIVAKDILIDVNVILEGKVSLGSRVSIGPNVYLKDVKIEDDVTILANSVVEGAHIGQGCMIGPFARVRPGTVLAEKVKIGNFVEIKKSSVEVNSKINHLSYIGDAIIGRDVNIGAGTITCNFDGKNKHQTVIKDGVSIGSDSQLIAPVTIGEGATIGAGTTVTKDVPANHLLHNQLQHRKIANWLKEEEK